MRPANEIFPLWLEKKSGGTRRGYRLAWRCFAEFVGVTPEGLEPVLLKRDYRTAHDLALDYQAHLSRRGLSPATVNFRIRAIQSWATFANRLGRLPWRINIPPLLTHYPAVTPPSIDALRLLYRHLRSEEDLFIRERDTSLSLMIFVFAMTRSEVSALNVSDLVLDSTEPRLLSARRGRERTHFVPPQILESLRSWLSVRPTAPTAALFLHHVPQPGRSERLRPEGVYYRTRQWSKRVGIRFRPHAIIHSGRTVAKDAGFRTGALLNHGGYADYFAKHYPDLCRNRPEEEIPFVLAAAITSGNAA